MDGSGVESHYRKLVRVIRRFNEMSGTDECLSLAPAHTAILDRNTGVYSVPLQGMSHTSIGKVLDAVRAVYVESEIVFRTSTKYSDVHLLKVALHSDTCTSPRTMLSDIDEAIASKRSRNIARRGDTPQHNGDDDRSNGIGAQHRNGSVSDSGGTHRHVNSDELGDDALTRACDVTQGNHDFMTILKSFVYGGGGGGGNMSTGERDARGANGTNDDNAMGDKKQNNVSRQYSTRPDDSRHGDGNWNEQRATRQRLGGAGEDGFGDNHGNRRYAPGDEENSEADYVYERANGGYNDYGEDRHGVYDDDYEYEEDRVRSGARFNDVAIGNEEESDDGEYGEQAAYASCISNGNGGYDDGFYQDYSADDEEGDLVRQHDALDDRMDRVRSGRSCDEKCKRVLVGVIKFIVCMSFLAMVLSFLIACVFFTAVLKDDGQCSLDAISRTAHAFDANRSSTLNAYNDNKFENRTGTGGDLYNMLNVMTGNAYLLYSYSVAARRACIGSWRNWTNGDFVSQGNHRYDAAETTSYSTHARQRETKPHTNTDAIRMRVLNANPPHDSGSLYNAYNTRGFQDEMTKNSRGGGDTRVVDDNEQSYTPSLMYTVFSIIAQACYGDQIDTMSAAPRVDDNDAFAKGARKFDFQSYALTYDDMPAYAKGERGSIENNGHDNKQYDMDIDIDYGITDDKNDVVIDLKRMD